MDDIDIESEFHLFISTVATEKYHDRLLADTAKIPAVQYESDNDNIKQLSLRCYVYFGPFPPFAPDAALLGGAAGAGLVNASTTSRTAALWARAVKLPLPILPPDLACSAVE